jgi:hypothetical protein
VLQRLHARGGDIRVLLEVVVAIEQPGRRRWILFHPVILLLRLAGAPYQLFHLTLVSASQEETTEPAAPLCNESLPAALADFAPLHDRLIRAVLMERFLGIAHFVPQAPEEIAVGHPPSQSSAVRFRQQGERTLSGLSPGVDRML